MHGLQNQIEMDVKILCKGPSQQTESSSLWVCNLIADKGNPDERNIRTGLIDWIG
jgi:hypothetical protein